MNRRTIGRGRVIAGVGAVLTLIACFLPWLTAGTEGGLPPISKNAFEGGISILVFLAAVGILALIALPYAAGDQPQAVDRPAAFVLLVSIGIAGFAIRLIQLVGAGTLGLPDRALGLWLAAVGLAIMAWGVAEIAGERRTG